MPQITLTGVLLFMAILAFIGLLFWLRRSRISERREIGSQDDFDALVRSCPFQITSDLHYRCADRKVKAMLTRDVLGTGERGHKRLTLQDLAYIRLMRQSIVQYEEERPWVTIDCEEAARLLAKVQLLEHQCWAVSEQIYGYKLTYGRTQRLVDLARESAKYTRSFISGEFPPAVGDEHMQHRYEYDRDRLEERLDKALARTVMAMSLCQSEKVGRIRYPQPVSDLLQQASLVKSDECAVILRQALAQATLPDATAEPNDLAETLHALAIVTWRDLNRPEEAVPYFLEVLNSSTTPDEIAMEAYGDLGRLRAEAGEFTQAMDAFEQEQRIAERLSRDSAGVEIRNRLAMCNGHVSHRQYDQALQHLQYALEAASRQNLKFAGNHKREILERLIEVYCLAGRYKEATAVYDGPHKALRKTESTRMFDTRARLLRIADMLARNGRVQEADALRERANSAAMKCKKHGRSPRNDFPNAFSIVWKRRQAEKVLHDC